MSTMEYPLRNSAILICVSTIHIFNEINRFLYSWEEIPRPAKAYFGLFLSSVSLLPQRDYPISVQHF